MQALLAFVFLFLMSHILNITKEVNTMEKRILMTQQEAAAYLGTTVQTLNTWRHHGKNPIPFVRWGNRIRYRKEDIDTWLTANTVLN